MTQEWNKERIQQYIDSEIQESSTLEYKAGRALGRSDKEKNEISRDVSAFANAGGGVIIYGIAEFDEKSKKHLPERIDGINPAEFSKETLEQIINSKIQPIIEGIKITPVGLSESSVVYIVEILQSNTAHQAADMKYYMRYNFQRLAMEDSQIRDVMNREKWPDVVPEFSSKRVGRGPLHRVGHRDIEAHRYELAISLENNGTLLVRDYRLEFTFPKDLLCGMVNGFFQEQLNDAFNLYSYRSQNVFFPGEIFKITKDEVKFSYQMDDVVYPKMKIDRISIDWKLFADNMPFKEGSKSIIEITDF
jgi:hypothetical protein